MRKTFTALEGKMYLICNQNVWVLSEKNRKRILVASSTVSFTPTTGGNDVIRALTSFESPATAAASSWSRAVGSLTNK